MDKDVADRLELMSQEISTLQVKVMSDSKPWYREISNIVSVLALAFSFGTTYVSYVKSDSQDIQAKRQELRGLLQRLSALPKENVENYKKYSSDRQALDALNGYNAQENSFLSKQAAQLEDELTSSNVSAIEYYVVASALQQDSNVDKARKYYKYSLDNSTDFSTEVAAERALASLDFLQAHPESGRQTYQKALDIFTKYSSVDPFGRLYINVTTEQAWAYSEAAIGQMQFAVQHISDAEAMLRNVPSNPGVEGLKAGVAQTRAILAGGGPPPLPPPQPQQDLPGVTKASTGP